MVIRKCYAVCDYNGLASFLFKKHFSAEAFVLYQISASFLGMVSFCFRIEIKKSDSYIKHVNNKFKYDAGFVFHLLGRTC